MPDETPKPTFTEKLIRARVEAGEFLAETYREWSNDNAVTLGAALAFYTTFSMAPLLILVIAIFGLIIGKDTVQAEILKRAQELIGTQGASAIRTMIRAAYRPGTGFFATIIGVTVIVIGSTSALVMLRKALNIIWGAQETGEVPLWQVIKDRLLSLVMILVIGTLLLLSLMESVVLSVVMTFFQDVLPFAPSLMRLAEFGLSILLITLLFAVIYKMLPEVEIAWADVWVGSAITAVLFTLGKFVFGLYLGRSSITSAYGAASSLAIIMMWVYYSAQIFFIGAEMTQVYANRYGSRVRPKQKRGAGLGHQAQTSAGEGRES